MYVVIGRVDVDHEPGLLVVPLAWLLDHKDCIHHGCLSVSPLVTRGYLRVLTSDDAD